MSLLVADCPRCGAKSITFDVTHGLLIGAQYNWQRWFEAFCVCRNCNRSTVFVLSQKSSNDDELFRKLNLSQLAISLNQKLKIERYVSARDTNIQRPPDHVPDEIQEIFREGSTSVVTQCWNAAGAMFRTCVDMATRSLLPTEDAPNLNAKTRRDLGLRLPWLFANGKLPRDLERLSACIREDGNDGAHQGTLTKEDAEDLLDFTVELLERLYTEPERLNLADNRRKERRGAAKKQSETNESG